MQHGNNGGATDGVRTLSYLWKVDPTFRHPPECVIRSRYVAKGEDRTSTIIIDPTNIASFMGLLLQLPEFEELCSAWTKAELAKREMLEQLQTMATGRLRDFIDRSEQGPTPAQSQGRRRERASTDGVGARLQGNPVLEKIRAALPPQAPEAALAAARAEETWNQNGVGKLSTAEFYTKVFSETDANVLADIQLVLNTPGSPLLRGLAPEIIAKRATQVKGRLDVLRLSGVVPTTVVAAPAATPETPAAEGPADLTTGQESQATAVEESPEWPELLGGTRAAEAWMAQQSADTLQAVVDWLENNEVPAATSKKKAAARLLKKAQATSAPSGGVEMVTV